MSAEDSRRRILAVQRLHQATAHLNADEVEVLADVAARYVQGRQTYGALDLDRDLRDFVREGDDELLDFLGYRAAARLRRARAAGGGAA